jgi:curved DNA-binding protein CbpA
MSMLRGAELARAILRAPNRYALLSLGCSDGRTIELGADGFLNHEDEEVRKCYTRLAVHCHPDRCADVPDATKAFQALVRAYELTCKPDLRADDSEDSRSEDDGACPVPHFTLSRSFHHTALVSPGGEQATASAGARTRTAILPTPVTRTSLIIQRALPSYYRRGRGSRSQHAAD